ncbi:triose-phosphate isomerase [Brevirhabdus sp.]|uniref:triose-phosphate isomerase n=1 Tax=Brevirhabdus sp. TaxID=2004514 RepID=UPI00405A33A3
MRRKLAAGNWKMNGTREDLAQIDAMLQAHGACRCDLLICPPATLVQAACDRARGSTLMIGGQDCHDQPQGAHTGDISADMLADAGARAVILGHSERRQNHGERNETVRAKTAQAWQAGLMAVVCVGETEADRDAANTLDIVGGQLAGSIPDAATGANLVVAYEPVWAIGTGRVASLDQIGEVHDFIRGRLERRFGTGVGRSVRLLYGGSVKPDNAAQIFGVSNVDGALVGGASLTARDFSPIVAALDAST